MKIKIAHMYPDVLNLYGDQGNIATFRKRLEWRGIDWEVTKLPIGFTEDLDQFDIFFIGGGQDFEQGVLLEDLDDAKRKSIREQVEKDKTFLCICGGYQMMGNYYETADGNRYDYIGAANFYTKGGNKRLIGNYAFTFDARHKDSEKDVSSADERACRIESGSERHCIRHSAGHTHEHKESNGIEEKHIITGFENHSGRTYLGDGVRPLGRVLKGNGNNGEDGTEGVRYRNFFDTYSHGPVLPKNPYFADSLILSALNTKYGIVDIQELDDSLEIRAHREAMNIIGV